MARLDAYDGQTWARDIQSKTIEDEVETLIEFAESQAALFGLEEESEAETLTMGPPEQAADEELYQEESGRQTTPPNCNGPADPSL